MTEPDPTLTHLDQRGNAQMVNIGEKPITERRAIAAGFVRCSAELIERIRRDDLAKGSVLQVARLAGIQAAKRTDEIIPLCHALPLDSVDVELELREDGVEIRATARATWKTGVEMEAYTAVCAAALTVIDMGKAVDRTMVIGNVRLLEKTGGKSGDYFAEPAAHEEKEHGS